jgi:hypothetical protein
MKLKDFENAPDESNRGEAGIEEILNGLSKEELVSIITEQAEYDRKLHNLIMARYSYTGKDGLAACKALVLEHINSVKYRGFITQRDAFQAMEGARIVLDKARRTADSGDTIGAVELCLVVLPIVAGTLQYCDDSDGDVGTAINECLAVMDDALKSDKSSLTSSDSEYLFGKILKEAQNRRYDGWSDSRMELLKLCSYMCDNPKLRERLSKYLDKLLTEADARGNGFEYWISEIKLLQLDLIRRYGGDETPKAFIEKNLKYSRFRDLAIDNAMANRDYAEAIRLCNDGINANKSYPGLVSTWRKALYKAYECLGDIDNQRQLARELLLGLCDDYYPVLKLLYTAIEWPVIRDDVLSIFETQPYLPDTYVKILIGEGLKTRLLKYCLKTPYRILDLYPHLIETYPKEVKDLFTAHISAEAESANNRHAYKKVCSLIKTFRAAHGSTDCQNLTAELKGRYPRRPAFLEELSKIKV